MQSIEIRRRRRRCRYERKRIPNHVHVEGRHSAQHHSARVIALRLLLRDDGDRRLVLIAHRRLLFLPRRRRGGVAGGELRVQQRRNGRVVQRPPVLLLLLRVREVEARSVAAQLVGGDVVRDGGVLSVVEGAEPHPGPPPRQPDLRHPLPPLPLPRASEKLLLPGGVPLRPLTPAIHREAKVDAVLGRSKALRFTVVEIDHGSGSGGGTTAIITSVLEAVTSIHRH